jgi:hypothetical protein
MRWQTAAVVAVILAAVAYCMSLPDRDTLLEQFGRERWACADMVPRKSVTRSVGWVSGKSALSIMISSRSEISFLGLSCRSRKGLCMPFDGGWQRVITTFQTASGQRAITFDRKSNGVTGDWFTLARLTGALGMSLVSGLNEATHATVTVEGKGGKLFADEIDLAGFHDAMAACGF